MTNAEDAIGELVNTSGTGLFAGYYNDREATDARVHHGMFWSGDLAYRDSDGWIYFAGRSGDWLRVDGENLTTAPVERILQRLPAVNHVAVYAVPDERVGDQVMAAVVLQDDAELAPEEFSEFLSRQSDLSPKAWPRHVWLTDRAADHRNQQDPQTGVDRAGQYAVRGCAVASGRPDAHLRTGRSSRRRCTRRPGMRRLIPAF